MTDHALSADPSSKSGKLTGWHVFWIMLGFFGLMFTVNGIFLYHAITSFPGEDVKKSYLQGLDYNSTLDAKGSDGALRLACMTKILCSIWLTPLASPFRRVWYLSSCAIPAVRRTTRS